MAFYKKIITGENLSIDVLKKLIDQVKRFSPHIMVNTVEPLLYKNLLEFIDYTVANDLLCYVGTNGLLLDRLENELVDKGLSRLVVSIDGPPSVHNQIRGVSNIFEKAYKGMELIIDRKRKLNRNQPKIQVAYAISNYNYHCLEDTADIFNDLGVDVFSFSHLNFIDDWMANAHNNEYEHAFGEVSTSCISAVDPTKVDVNILTEQIKKVKSKYPSFAVFYPDLSTLEEVKKYYHSHEFMSAIRCDIAWTNIQILSNGNVIPGSRCFNLIMGNIYEENFLNIWNGASYQAFRENLRKYGATPACARCCGLPTISNYNKSEKQVHER
jgi:MoaA/NifB/PqqE/SkfB family radical SAM enzyme